MITFLVSLALLFVGAVLGVTAAYLVLALYVWHRLTR